NRALRAAVFPPLLAASFLLAAVAPAFSEAPNLITYQGRLKENNQPVTGSRTVEILLCDALTGGFCVTTGAQAVNVSTGLFKSTFTVPGALDLAAGPWYLELAVDDETTPDPAVTLSPRERLSSVPYALHASSAVFSSSSAYANALAAAGGATAVLSSTHVYLVNGSSLTVAGNVTAYKFVGDGSGLTGVTGASGTDATKVLKTGDTMTGPLAVSHIDYAVGVYVSSEAGPALGGGLRVSSNVYVVGFASATRYYGDGAALTGVSPSGAAGGALAGTYPNPSLANNASYPVAVGDGNGVKFGGGSDAFKISLGNAAEYHYAQVTNYSIKTFMDVTAGRGFTWGSSGSAPVAALSNTGVLQTAGGITSGGAQVIYGSATITGDDGGGPSAGYGLIVSSNVDLAGVLFTRGGNVGIGAAAPQGRLDVKAGG
ncbi:MAG TPA: hypothetical protein PL037_09045, partial [Elusimicrobiales bacterium]|nr:hypothetical protein [Elusimicrobiales bacterium]